MHQKCRAKSECVVGASAAAAASALFHAKCALSAINASHTIRIEFDAYVQQHWNAIEGVAFDKKSIHFPQPQKVNERLSFIYIQLSHLKEVSEEGEVTFV